MAGDTQGRPKGEGDFALGEDDTRTTYPEGSGDGGRDMAGFGEPLAVYDSSSVRIFEYPNW